MPSGWRPDPVQALLLEAALLDDDAARHAWERWLERQTLDQVHVADRRLLPAVYRNLAGIPGVPELARLRGIHRHEWYRNQLRFDAAGRLLCALEEAGIPTLVLKGGALALLDYPDAGCRPMGDVDVLVPPRQAAQAIAAVEAAGWRAEPAAPPDPISVAHAWTFSDGASGVVDLHWRALPYSRASEDDFWPAAVPLTLGGASTMAMAPTDLLLHVLVHGAEWNYDSPVRWVPDAVAVLRSAGDAIDWERLCALAARHEASHCAAELLDHLRGTFAPEVPDEAVARLRATRSSRAELALHRARVAAPHRVRRSIRIQWASYRALRATGGRRLTFPTFVLRRWRVRNARELLAFAARTVRTRTRAAPLVSALARSRGGA